MCLRDSQRVSAPLLQSPQSHRRVINGGKQRLIITKRYKKSLRSCPKIQKLNFKQCQNIHDLNSI